MKNTDTKERIMEMLFDFPIRRFHIRELSRMLNVSPPAISKAIVQLEKEEMINLEKKLAYEISAKITTSFIQKKRIHNLKKLYESDLVSYLIEKYPFSTIILFGSYSRGEDTEKSDIDIALIGKEKPLEIEKFEKILNRRINIEFLDLSKAPKELKNSILNGIRLQGYTET